MQNTRLTVAVCHDQTNQKQRTVQMLQVDSLASVFVCGSELTDTKQLACLSFSLKATLRFDLSASGLARAETQNLCASCL